MNNIRVTKKGTIKADNLTPMEQEIIDILNSNSYDNNRADTIAMIDDLTRHGCASGMISEMIYYSDTCEFYQRHGREISQLLNDIDTRPDQLNGWDEEDPLAQDTSNQNMLAWAAVEITAGYILDAV